MNSNHRVVSLSAVLLLSGALVSPSVCSASAPITASISDGNSTAVVDMSSGAGMNYWAVDGQNQLHQQWFWYRVGSGVAQPINSIGALSTSSTGGNDLTVTYTGAQFNLSVDYLLTGGGAGTGSADIQESIMVHNKTGSVIDDFHLYQYSNFDLLNDPAGDTVQLFGNSTDGYTLAYQNKGPTQIAEAINLPPGNHAEANKTPNTLNSLNTTSDLVLNDNTYDTGDVTWALQWDTSISSTEDFYIFKDKTLSIEPIPEPCTLALIVLGIGAWCAARRRQTS